MSITDADVRSFESNGFLRVDRLVSGAELVALRSAYDGIVAEQVGPDSEQMLGGITRRVMFPSLMDDRFHDNAALQAGLEIGERLLGVACRRAFDMLIVKPPGHPHETPWHQDMSYTALPFASAGARPSMPTLQFWVAMDDVDAENGCMHFVPGLHRQPMMEHAIASGADDDPHRLLALADRDALEGMSVVACPLNAGGCTIHADNTPHYTPANSSLDRPRRAYIFNLTPQR